MTTRGKTLTYFALPAAAILFFGLVSPETLTRGPDLCLWKQVFSLRACPACGSTRALAAFFHGDFAGAVAFHWNVVVTGPGLVFFAVRALLHLRMIGRLQSGDNGMPPARI